MLRQIKFQVHTKLIIIICQSDASETIQLPPTHLLKLDEISTEDFLQDWKKKKKIQMTDAFYEKNN